MIDAYDVVGIGVGPANLALAIALDEEQSVGGRTPRTHFIERKREFCWHPGMLLPGATVQVSYLKDLVTLRNPCSAFSFLNFLKSQGRLEYFVNLKEWHPSRQEFNEYFQWVASHFAQKISYNSTATEIAATKLRGEPVFSVTVSDLDTARRRTILAKHLSVGCGGTPFMPEFVAPYASHPSVCHSCQFISAIAPFQSTPYEPYDFVVVGRGQSAAEIAAFLLENFPNATTTVVLQGYSFMAVDENPFANEIFFNAGVDLFSSSSPATRTQLHTECERTNYSVVDGELLNRLYKIYYHDRAAGRARLKVRNLARIIGLDIENHRSVVALSDNQTHQMSRIPAHLSVFATGYRRTEATDLLSGLEPYLSRNEKNEIKIDRFCRVETVGLGRAQLFLHGESEEAHGISSSLLSVLPFRAAEIAGMVRNSLDTRGGESFYAAA